MPKQHNYYVYIMASINGVLYVGVTNNLERRVHEHKSGAVKGFTKKYHIKKLIYFETFNNIDDAIHREKEIKKWRREKKIFLIEKENPNWTDLSLQFV